MYIVADHGRGMDSYVAGETYIVFFSDENRCYFSAGGYVEGFSAQAPVTLIANIKINYMLFAPAK